MSFGIGKPVLRSAAWRISLWATLAFALGTMLVFIFLHRFVAADYQQRSDAWLSGEVSVLSDVASRTPQNNLHRRVVSEIAELASREVPEKLRSQDGSNASVFFLQTTSDGKLALWVGAGDGSTALRAIHERNQPSGAPFSVYGLDRTVPFRVASVRMDDGGSVYLGLSERDERRLLRNLRFRFVSLWLIIVLLGFAIVFYSTRQMLGDVREITEVASRIGDDDLSKRVPTNNRNDEVAQLASTLNGMFGRIESTMHQLHTITDSLAHDLRSPLTAIRAKLEMSLGNAARGREAELTVAAIDELDRLTEMLNRSLDIAEARADALRLSRTAIDLDELLRVMVELYEPNMAAKGLRLELASAGRLEAYADAGLLHRMVANLFDNEIKHLPSASTVTISLSAADEYAVLVFEDDGPGFAAEIGNDLFKPRVRGIQSSGHGLGLAFVEAVVGAHHGTVTAANRPGSGARLEIRLPMIAVAEPALR